MKSPFTGGPVELKKVQSEKVFRKEKFEITEHFYVCRDTGQEFTTTDIDQLNLNQVYNQYREKNGIPFPDQIKKIREKYRVSAAKMAEILGFGVNVYRLYEQGEIPNTSNGRLILAADDPGEFRKFIELSKANLSGNEYKKYSRRADELIEETKKEGFFFRSFREKFESILPNEYTGYRMPDLNKVSQMIIFFSKQTQTWKTKLNKLLFYTDFLSFSKRGFAISGMDYRAIQMGPVPAHFDKIYTELSDEGVLNRKYEEIDDGIYGEFFLPGSIREFDPSLFDPVELELMEKAAMTFRSKTAGELKELSHREQAWQECFPDHEKISFRKYGFTISAIS